MNRFLSAAAAIAVSLFNATQPSVPRIAARDAKKFLDAEVTMCGRVVAYDCSKSRDTVLLNVEKPYWAGAASIGIRSAQRPAFGDRFEEQYLGANVCATGRVARIDRRYAVIVDVPESLVLTDVSPVRPPTFAPDASQSCAPDVQLPTVVHAVQPAYTREAMQFRTQGRMLVDAVVLPDGTIGDVRVIHSLDQTHGLDDQGVAAVKQWRFKPGRLRDQLVPLIVTVELAFRLK